MIEFLTSDGRVIDVVANRAGELVSGPVMRDVARAWLRQGKSPDSFEDAYATWTNGYNSSRRVADDTSRISELKPINTPILVASAFHLPGRHEQKSHGRRHGKVGSKNNTAKSLTDILNSDTITKLLDDPESFDYSSKKSADRILAEIVKQRGFDAKPTLVHSLPAGSTPMGRAVTDRQFAEQFLTGDYFAGKGQFGNGTYFLQTSDASNLDKTLSLYGDHKIHAALKPGARTVTRTDLEAEMKSLVADAEQNEKDVYGKALDYIQRGDMDGFQRDYSRAQRRTQLLRDPGRVAALLGYDAIFVTPGQSDTEVVVLNRGAIQAERKVR